MYYTIPNMRNGLVISSGHRSSNGVIISGNEFLALFTAPALNHHAALYGDLILAYTRLLKQCLGPLACTTVPQLSDLLDFILLCLPGAATEFDKQIVLSFLVRCGWSERCLDKVHVVDDTWAGAVAATDQDRVVFGIADSGSSVFVYTGTFPTSRKSKFDGWGALIGDNGSKFQLALEALRSISKELDTGLKPNLLTLLQDSNDDLRALSDLQLWFDNILNEGHTIWRQKIADLALPILRAADDSPAEYPEALQLVQHAARSFAETLDVAMRSFSPESHSMEIVISGDMMTSRVFRERLSYEATRRFSRTVRPSRYSTLTGAVLMAGNLPSKLPTPDWRQRVLSYFDSAPDSMRPAYVDGVS